MKYKVFFTTGETLYITEDRYIQIHKNEPVDLMKFFEKDYPYIEMKFVTHIIREDSLDQEGSVVTSLTPEDILKQKKEEHDKKVSDPNAIIAGVKDKEDIHG